MCEYEISLTTREILFLRFLKYAGTVDLYVSFPLMMVFA